MITRHLSPWPTALLSVIVFAACGQSAGTKKAGDDKEDSGASSAGQMNDGGDPSQHEAGTMPGTDSSLPGEKSQAKVVSVGPPYVVADEKYQYTPKSSEAESPKWKVVAGPPGLTVDEKQVSFTPSKDDSGSHNVVIEGMSGEKLVSQEYELTVAVAEKRADGVATPKDGGQVQVNSPTSKIQGASVSTRPGAVQEEKTITISELDRAPPMANSTGALNAVEFGPKGLAFGQPALIALPLPDDVVLSASRVGAFVYNPAGRWERVRAVGIDLDQRFIFAQAQHFSVYAAAQSNLDMDVSVERMPSSTGCEGTLVGQSRVDSPLAELESKAINNRSALIRTLIEAGAGNVQELLSHPSFSGSLRFARVFELSQGDGADAVAIEERIAVSTLYAPGDGSAVLRHTRASGQLIAELSFADLAGSLPTISEHLRGAASHVLFSSQTNEPVSVAARLHIAYFEEDASLDPVSIHDLGLAAIDVAPSSAGTPDTAAGFDLDCDRLANAYDSIDDRLLAKLVAEPDDVISTFAGSAVQLRARSENVADVSQLAWRIIAGDGSLSAVAGDEHARGFQASSAGRHLVEVSLPRSALSSTFVIDVRSVPVLNTPPTCTPAAGALSIKLGETVGLSAIASDAESERGALSVEWGLVDHATVPATLLSNAQLQIFGQGARLTPSATGQYQVGCRAWDGTAFGPIGQLNVAVLDAQSNRLPENLFLSPPSATLLVGQTLKFRAQGSDPDGDALSFAWSTSAGSLGAASSTTSTSAVTLTPSGVGTYVVSVSIGDGKAAARQLSANVLVINNVGELSGADADRDGFPVGDGPGFDCDDNNAAVRPGAKDICGNELNEDCVDGARVDDCDDDGFTIAQGDCRDGDARVHPQAVELCNGIDDNCSQGVDEGFAINVSCSVGLGNCLRIGKRACAADGINVVCTAQPGAPSTETCDGIDQDCDGAIDQGLNCQGTEPGNSCVILAEVCNGLDDDCDSQVDEGVSCLPQSGECKPQGAEVCNTQDDDCDGKFDEGNVCGLTPVAGSIVGVWWECVDQTCQAMHETGLGFTASGQVQFLQSFGEQPYDPLAGPYCGDGGGAYSVADGVITFTIVEGQTPQQFRGTLLVDGTRATVTWLAGEAPPDSVAKVELIRVPEQPAGLCPSGGAECLPGEQGLCNNGFDDDCDGCPDGNDTDCGGPGCGGTSPCAPSEICGNDKNDDCDQFVHDMDDNECQPSCADSPQQPACASAGESCSNATDISARGLFSNTLGSINDVNPNCEPFSTVDRVFFFDLPEGPQTEVVLGVSAGPLANLSLSILPVGPGALPDACPTIKPGEAFCSFGSQQFRQYLAGGKRYFVFVEGARAGEAFTLQFATRRESACSPADGDGDGQSICDGDCNDDNGTTYSGAEELCDGLDNNCNGMVDELAFNEVSTCTTGLLGVCAIGRPSCDQQQACTPIQRSLSDYCGDGADNDCDGAADELDCVNAPGEACSNAYAIGTGGTFSGTLAGATNDALSGCGFDGADVFYAFNIEGDGAEVIFQGQRSPDRAARYLLYQDCTLQPVQCDMHEYMHLEPGNYVLAVEPDGSQGNPNYQFSIAFSANGACLTPDGDGDGQTLCAGDCDDNNANVYQGGVEGDTSDGLDNDCNGKVDDLPCTVPGALGVCSEGRLHVFPASSSCEPLYQADPRNRDFCDDGLDNDCDGFVDDLDAQGCVSLPVGDICSLAEDISQGGIFAHSLEGYSNLADVGCGDDSGEFGQVERFYSLTIGEARRVHLDFGSNQFPHSLGIVMATSCASMRPQSTCMGGYFDQVLDAGTYIFAVHAKQLTSYTLRVFSSLPDDPSGTSCLPADSDADGFSLCSNDCDEQNPDVNPNGLEICNGIDDDCNGLVDDGIPCGGGDICGGYGGDINGCQQDPNCLWDEQGMKCLSAGAPSCSCDIGPSCDLMPDGKPCGCDPGCGTQQCQFDGNFCTSGSECCSGFCDFAFNQCAPGAPPPQSGEACQDALFIGPGMYQGDLTFAKDDVFTNCGAGGPDHVYTFTLSTLATVEIGFGGPVSWAVLNECMGGAPLECGSGGSMYSNTLEPGVYFLVLEGSGPYSFSLDIFEIMP